MIRKIKIQRQLIIKNIIILYCNMHSHGDYLS